MTRTLTKLDVARHQLGTAMDLFIRDRDPISVQCLACGGGELIEGIAKLQNISTLSTHMLETVPNLDIVKLINLQRLYWNAFKHMNNQKGQVRNDADVLAAFDDTKNDAALFVGWAGFYSVTRRLPLPVQVFQVWWYSLNEEKLTPNSDISVIRSVFPDITSCTRLEQKRRLRRAVEKYRHDKAVLSDARTERNPLCFPASVFLSGLPTRTSEAL